MKISLTKICSAIPLMLAVTGIATAQTNQPTPAQQTGYPTRGTTDTENGTNLAPNTIAATQPDKRIGFRLPDWKTIHSHDQAAANADLETLKQIGFEAKTANHGNHIDVQYRCPNWRTIEVPTEELATKWSTWLTAKGAETVIVNPPTDTTAPTVQYRMPTVRTLHLHDSEESTQILTTMKMIGVTVTTNPHGDHTDASFQCPEWKTIQLPTDNHAHAWQTWLDNAGFETKHTH